MKKFFAVAIALMLMLNCMAALADSVYTKVNVNSDVLKSVLTGFGMPEEQLGIADPFLAVINALGVNVITTADGTQIDLDLNSNEALSVAFKMDDQGIALASTLFPSYTVTVSQEMLAQVMESVAANMPAGTNTNMMDLTAVSETFSGYFTRYMETCSAAGQPGEPVSGEFEYEGYKFDTMVPVTVDMPTVREATKTLMNDLMNDETAMNMIKTAVQQQNPEAEFDPAELQSFFDEWLAHIPDAASAELYAMSSGEPTFYMLGQAFYDGRTDPSFGFDMLFVDDNHMSMSFASFDDDMKMECIFVLADSSMYASFRIPDMFFGFGMEFGDTALHFDVYFMNEDTPLLTMDMTQSDAGTLTLDLNDSSRTVVPVEEIMGGESEAANGLISDITGNAFSLVFTLMDAVPEAASLVDSFIGGGAQ